MRLNPDCTRDILMFMEEKTEPHSFLSFSPDSFAEQSVKLSQYSEKELIYHVKQAAESGFFLGYKEDLSGGFWLRDLSPKAHEFLANIRSDNIWNKTKSVACKIGATSMNALIQIASNVVTEIIKQQLTL